MEIEVGMRILFHDLSDFSLLSLLGEMPIYEAIVRELSPDGKYARLFIYSSGEFRRPKEKWMKVEDVGLISILEGGASPTEERKEEDKDGDLWL